MPVCASKLEIAAVMPPLHMESTDVSLLVAIANTRDIPISMHW